MVGRGLPAYKGSASGGEVCSSEVEGQGSSLVAHGGAVGGGVHAQSAGEVKACSSGGSAWRGGHGHGGRGERSQAGGVGKLGRRVRESEAEQSSTARCGSERRSGAREKLSATGVVACASGTVANLATVSTHGRGESYTCGLIFLTQFEFSNLV